MCEHTTCTTKAEVVAVPRRVHLLQKGAQAARLRSALTAIHRGEADDRHGWLTAI